MENNKNTVEEALLQIRNLEEALQENVKGVLRSTMKEEIKELVKESLNEQAEVEDEEEDFDIEDAGAEDEVEVDDTEFDMGDEEEMDSEEGDMEFDMGDEEEFDAEDETVDLTGASDEEVLKVFKAMGDEDGIIVKKENDMVHLEDGEDEYLIQLEESYMEEGSDELSSKDFEFNEGDSMGSTETLYEVEFEDEDEDEDEDFEELSFDDEDEDEDEDFSEFSFDDEDEDEEEDFSEFSFDDEDEDEDEEYSDDEDEDYEEMEEESMGNLENQIMEALKSKMKPKGVGMGNPSKFKYNKKPNMSGGFNEKRKEGPKSVGTGKAKFEYKEGENMGKNPNKKVVAKKEETKEAVRINSYARANKVGNRKGFNQNVNREEIRQRPNTRKVNEEVEMLRERNEEYKKALDVFRTKLNEVAVFNSNLAYATRLFTEHSTTKQEKINILRRFDNVESLKESKTLYRSIKDELSSNSSTGEQITESIERNVNRTVSTGSAVNLIESKTYENPQFLRMKDLMSKL